MGKWLVVVLLLTAFGVGNTFKFQFVYPEASITLLDCAVFLLTIITLFVKRNEIVKRVKDSGYLTSPIFTFFSLAGLSLLISGAVYGLDPQIVGSFYLLRWVTYSLLFLAIICLFKAHEVLKLLLGLGLLTTILGLGQYIFYPDVRQLEISEWDPHYYRVVGTWIDPGFTGLLLVFTLVLLTVGVGEPNKLQRVFWWVTYAALALTYSRSSYLAFLVAMVWIGWKKKGGKLIMRMLLLLVATVILLPRAPQGEGVKLERTASIWARVENWGYAVRVFIDHPLLGVGFNTYRYAQKEYGFLAPDKWLVSHAGAGADASLLFVAATTGILGLLAYLWYIERLWVFSSQYLALQASLAAWLVHSWLLNSLFYPAVMVWISLLVATTALKSQ